MKDQNRKTTEQKKSDASSKKRKHRERVEENLRAILQRRLAFSRR